MRAQNICGDQPKVSDGLPKASDPLPLELFVNPGCFPALAATEVIIEEVDQSKAKEELEKSAFVGN